jgi:hypothetical protein
MKQPVKYIQFYGQLFDVFQKKSWDLWLNASIDFVSLSRTMVMNPRNYPDGFHGFWSSVGKFLIFRQVHVQVRDQALGQVLKYWDQSINVFLELSLELDKQSTFFLMLLEPK